MTYCNYQCSRLQLLSYCLIQVVLLCKYLPKLSGKWSELNNRFEVVKLSILTMVVSVTTIAMFMVNQLFLYKYTNDFTMNMGYLLIYFSIFWGFQAVYLSELISSSVDCHNQVIIIREEQRKGKDREDRDEDCLQ